MAAGLALQCLLGLFCKQGCVMAAGGEDGACDASSAPGGCSSGLQWRGYPYRVTKPVYAKKIYGGGFVIDAFAQAGFEGPMDGEDWDVLWTHRPQHDWLREHVQLPAREGERVVNHCAYFRGAGDKCAFADVTRSLALHAPDATTSGYLQTYQLNIGTQRQEWVEALQADSKRYWLVKPCYGGDSKGIRVERADKLLANLQLEKDAVAQEYLDNPWHGFGGKKFHLRLYILVAHASPTKRVYLFNDGMAFRSTHAHKAGGKRSADRDTFSSISKTVEGVALEELWQAIDEDAAAPASSTVWTRVTALLQNIMASPSSWIDAGRMKEEDAQRGFGCFDLFGADVLLDDKLWPWVMEFNLGANMWVDDKGTGSKEKLLRCKRPLMEQVTRWLALRTGSSTATKAELEAQEAATLVNFTRLV